jgi:regulator of nonsense transcripts 3
MSTPKVLSRKANGVASNSAPSDAPKAPRTKAAPEGEKVVIRRLPPAMTQDEFFSNLGDEWKPGNGKTDWLRYCAGKVSQQ